ncbi:MAG: efflux RND transporter periplasmic adaptor subunit [Deltaproteobacteria bacterium]|nr:efflux RND transporter periplasmic adaptor subunit [Deltaproteobacteria bacterium]
MKRMSVILLFLLVFGTGSIVVFRYSRGIPAEPSTTSSENTRIAVDVISPSRTTLKRSVEVFGSLSAKNVTEVKSELPGRVLQIRVKEWDHVSPKDILLEMDPMDYKLELQRSQAGLKIAEAQLLKAKVDLNRAKRELNRTLKLKEGGLVTGQELDERRTALESAEAQVALADAQVGQARAQLAESNRNLQKSSILAPIQGIVSERKVDVGDWVDKGAHLFSIVDNRILDFTATVSAIDLPLVHEGQLLTFTVDGLSNRVFEGRVHRVNPTVNASDRSGRIQAEVKNSDDILRGGVFARGQVVVEERHDIMVVPADCLVGWDMEKETARVFVVTEGGVAHSKEIRTGLTEGGKVEILGGLTGAEWVVSRGGFNLREGDGVYISNQEGNP